MPCQPRGPVTTRHRSAHHLLLSMSRFPSPDTAARRVHCFAVPEAPFPVLACPFCARSNVTGTPGAGRSPRYQAQTALFPGRKRFPSESVAPTSLRSVQVHRNSSTISCDNTSRSRCSTLRMPRLTLRFLWPEANDSGGSLDGSIGSQPQVSDPIMAIVRVAKESQTSRLTPGSPALHSA